MIKRHVVLSYSNKGYTNGGNNTTTKTRAYKVSAQKINQPVGSISQARPSIDKEEEFITPVEAVVMEVHVASI